jgi:GDP-L-fucose synthase
MNEYFPLNGRRVMVAGAKGMAGSALIQRLASEDCDVVSADRSDVDFSRQDEVEAFFDANHPDALFLAAARVGGIGANAARPAEFLYENLVIETNVIHAAYRTGIKKLVFLGSSCIYPREAPQPIVEEALLTGPLEPTNEAYALAKIAGLKLCQAYRHQYGCDFIAAMPTNLYGPGDRYDLANGHVVAALIMKIHAAKQSGAETVVLWGSGMPRREFLYTGDLADGLVFMLKHYSDALPLNLGTGQEHSIADLASAIAAAAQWTGTFVFDRSKPDGMPRKVMDVSRLAALGWTAQTRFEDGIASAYDWYVANKAGTLASAP